MRVLLFGATGMIGRGVLLECLEDPGVVEVVAIVRSPLEVTHPKLKTLHHSDYFDYSAIRDQLAGFDACFFCLGVTAAGKSEAEYERLTYTLTLAAATTLAELNPGMTFCYVSGQSTDSTEKGRVMWARVKGRTENALLAMDGLDAYMFRPGFVLPMKGVRSKTVLYEFFYSAFRPFLGLVPRLAPKYSTTSVNIGLAMLRVAREGAGKRHLENVDIDALASPEGAENT